METSEPYNPLHKKNLGDSVAEALLEKEPQALPPVPFEGAGIYAIYYSGGFPAYAPITAKNQKGRCRWPIYVGKAVPQGARKGGLGLEAPSGTVLYNRLCQHAKSIEQARNLSLGDFKCRYLAVDDIWIPLGESLLVEKLNPLWNRVVEGFGNHDPGSGRHAGKKPAWDVIHPGRPWARRCQPGKPEKEICAEIEAYYASIKPK